LTKKHDVHPCPAVKKIGIQFNLLPKKKPKIYYLGKRNQKDNCIIKKKVENNISITIKVCEEQFDIAIPPNWTGSYTSFESPYFQLGFGAVRYQKTLILADLNQLK